MSRRVFDVLASTVGLVMVVVLLVAGGLLMWGQSFANSNVHNQLAEQQIFFPPKSAFEHPKAGTEITPAMIPSVSQYAGQQLLTGQQAEAWANHFIAEHLKEMPYERRLRRRSAPPRAKNREDKELAALEQTSFQGTTLRGLLLEAYGFSTIGEVMFWGAIASFCLAAIMALLVALGFRHAARTRSEDELLRHTPSPGRLHRWRQAHTIPPND